MKRLAIALALTAIVTAAVAVQAASVLDGPRATTDAALEAERAATDQHIAALEDRIAELEASLSSSPEPSPSPSPSLPPSPSPSPSPTGCTVTVPAGGNIAGAIANAPTGATICLSGRYDVGAPLRPKDRQSFVGPATLVGSGTDGFDMRTNDSDDVTLVGLDMSGFDDAVSCWEGTHVLGGRLHHNDGNGVGCGLQYAGGREVLVDGVEIDHNGDPADLGVGAGGIKIARLGPGGFTLRNSHLHDNLGNGVWCDVQCIGLYLIEHNTIERNGRKGVHYEKSGASDEFGGIGVVCLGGCGQGVTEGQAIVRFNVVRDNGTEGREFAQDAGITNVSSRNMLVHDNVTSGTPRGGIVFHQDSRTSGDKHGWKVGGVIRDNQASDGIRGCDLAGVTCSGNTT